MYCKAYSFLKVSHALKFLYQVSRVRVNSKNWWVAFESPSPISWVYISFWFWISDGKYFLTPLSSRDHVEPEWFIGKSCSEINFLYSVTYFFSQLYRRSTFLKENLNTLTNIILYSSYHTVKWFMPPLLPWPFPQSNSFKNKFIIRNTVLIWVTLINVNVRYLYLFWYYLH